MLFAMHIPDGFLSPGVTIATLVLALVAVAVALRCVRKNEGDRVVPLLGVMAAAIFAAQMVNVPLIGGQASGHLLGGVLAAVVLGPAGGVVAITAVLVVQCFLFGDGGVVALGANVVNMAVIGSAGGYGLYRMLHRAIGGPRGAVIAAVVASWLIIPIAALAFAVEMSLGGHVEFRSIATLMLFYHVIIGLGESLVTGLVVAWLVEVRPDLIYDLSAGQQPPRRYGRVIAAGATLGIALAVFAAPFASELADGLETVAMRLGFADNAEETAFAPFPDYSLPQRDAVGQEPPTAVNVAAATTSALGVLGTMATWGFALVLGSGVRMGIHRSGSMHAL
jgi:cobalt/nickel transport system permease protein